MLNVHVRPSRDLRNNYAALAGIVKNRDQVIITNNGRGEAVLIGIDEYAEFQEFAHRRYVMESLAKAKEYAARPDAIWLSDDAFWSEFENEV
jgi:prevent-host-death family protein